jgi:biotin operon repressor
MGRGRPKASGAEAQQIMDRRMKVLALRRDGRTLAAIGAALEISTGAVGTDIKWLREQGYDVGEGHTGRKLPPPGTDILQLRAVAAADDEATVRREVHDRRVRGEDILAISYAMKISTHDVRRHLLEAQRLMRESDIEAKRELQIARLEELLRCLWPDVQDANPKAANAAVRAMAELHRLQGLYRPIQVEHTVITTDMIDHEMARLTAELERLEGAPAYVDGETVDD